MKNKNLTIILPVPTQLLERRIYLIRGVKVMIDSDLAELYNVKTFNFNKAVKRNIERFPVDFMFQLNKEEYQNLIFQIGISSSSYGGRRFLPYAFTEQGVAMLSSVLNSKRAIAVNIAIMRAFVRLRQVMSKNKNLAKEMKKLETGQKRLQIDVAVIFHVIKKLLQKQSPPQGSPQKIGFRT